MTSLYIVYLNNAKKLPQIGGPSNWENVSKSFWQDWNSVRQNSKFIFFLYQYSWECWVCAWKVSSLLVRCVSQADQRISTCRQCQYSHRTLDIEWGAPPPSLPCTIRGVRYIDCTWDPSESNMIAYINIDRMSPDWNWLQLQQLQNISTFFPFPTFC